nr:MAG TPA: hypothetical protein [Caudoviricetes sp.]
MYFHEVTSNFLSPVRGLCRSRACQRSDLLHHLQKLLIIFHKGGCILRPLLR